MKPKIKSQSLQENRDKLINLSNDLLKKAHMNRSQVRVNDLLYKHYNPDSSLIFNSYKKWLESGRQVSKGQKAFLFWGTPPKHKNPESENIDDSPMKYFPLAYLFTEQQTELIKPQ